MPTYQMDIVSQTLTITADTEEQAEEKYNAYFGGGDCPCALGDKCDCVEDSEEVFHTTEKIGD